MKKIVFLLIGICFLQSSCKKQNDSKSDFNNKAKNAKDKITKKLDKKRILLYQSLDKHKYIANDTLFKLEESNDIYTEIKKPIHNNFEKHSYYDKNSLKLKSDCYYFSNMVIGIYKIYDENGNLIKEIDCDKDYNFTLDDLILKVKKEFKIDLNKDLERIEIRRTSDNISDFPFYNINIFLANINGYPKFRNITIDGKFGFITSDRTYIARED